MLQVYLSTTFFCPQSYTAPYQVSVKGGNLIRPLAATGRQVYVMTMEEIFDEIDQVCFSGCPDSGPASCDITYAPEGYVTQVSINPIEMIADEEIFYTVTGFDFCFAQ